MGDSSSDRIILVLSIASTPNSILIYISLVAFKRTFPNAPPIAKMAAKYACSVMTAFVRAFLWVFLEVGGWYLEKGWGIVFKWTSRTRPKVFNVIVGEWQQDHRELKLMPACFHYEKHRHVSPEACKLHKGLNSGYSPGCSWLSKGVGTMGLLETCVLKLRSPPKNNILIVMFVKNK